MMRNRALAAPTLALIVSLSGPALAQANGGRDDSGATYPPPTYAPQPQPQPQPPPPTYYAPPPYGQPPYGQPTYNAPPKRLPYNEGDPVPAGYHVSTHLRTGLVVAGSVLFGVFYGLTVAGAGSVDSSDGNRLLIPVFGPVLYGNTLTGDWRNFSRFFLWIDTLAQTAGATMLIVGVAAPKTELVRNDLGSVHIQPLVGRGTGGLALGGSF